MTDKERIAEILKAYTKKHGIMASSVILDEYAEELIANGVIVPPCKVGDTVYMPFDGEITPFFIYQIRREENVDFITSCYDSGGYDTRGKPVLTTFCDYHIGKTVFLTKEEAEQALKERE